MHPTIKIITIISSILTILTVLTMYFVTKSLYNISILLNDSSPIYAAGILTGVFSSFLSILWALTIFAILNPKRVIIEEFHHELEGER